MKRILSVLLALAMAVPMMTTVAFAEKQPSGYFSGIASFDEAEFDPGETVMLNIDYFYGKWTETEKEWDDVKGREVTVKKTVDNQEEPISYLDGDYHKVTASWTKGGQYIQNVYFEDGDNFVSIELKGEASVEDREIRGTIKIQESGIPNRPKVTYECKILKDTLIIKGVDEKSRMVSLGDRKFGLPDDYQTKQVRFSHDEDGSYGTFIGDFRSKSSGYQVAEFRVRILDQKSLYLGFSESANKTIANKYPNAELTFLDWTARPTFEYAGTLSIVMDPDQYIYGIKDDNTLYSLGGKYNADEYVYVMENVKTLGSYVISDTQLSASGSSSSGGSSSGSGGGGGGGTTLNPSSSAAPSSTAPSSTAPSSTAPPPVSSTAPVPSSSVAPPPSSSEESSSEPEESSSEPEDEEPDDPEDEEPYDPDDDDEGDDDDEKKPEKKKFPLIPVLLGVLGIVILVCAVVVVGNRSNSRGRSRRRRYDDDWDD